MLFNINVFWSLITIKNKHILLGILTFITKQVFYVEVTFKRTFGKNQLNSIYTILLCATYLKDAEDSFSSIAHRLILEKIAKSYLFKEEFLSPTFLIQSSTSLPLVSEVMFMGVPKKKSKKR